MAVIGQTLIQQGQQNILRYTSTYDDYIRADTDNRFWLVNTNKMIRTYPGMDGLKTGYTTQSMYCITVTAQRDGLRLLAVVMDEPTRDVRNQEAAALLDYGFSNYRYQIVMEKGTPVATARIDNGKPETVAVLTGGELGRITAGGSSMEPSESEILMDSLRAPIQQGEVIGRLRLHFEDGVVIEEDLVAEESVLALDFIDILLKTWKTVIF